MLAKIIATGATREEARRRLVQALEDTVALGTTTNRAFLIEALNHPEFVAGKATTSSSRSISERSPLQYLMMFILL